MMEVQTPKFRAMREIARLNPTARPDFLEAFSERALERYADQLRRLETELGTDRLLRPIEPELE